MVRNAIRLMEILSFLYMVAAAYNVKLKYNIYAVVFVISELFLLPDWKIPVCMHTVMSNATAISRNPMIQSNCLSL